MPDNMKTAIACVAIAVGVLGGIVSMYLGYRKSGQEKKEFHFTAFLKKTFRVVDFNEHSGKEMMALGFLAWLGSAIVYVIYFLVLR